MKKTKKSPKANKAIERSKHKANNDLISALIQYRESTKAAGRYPLSEWAHVQLARIVAQGHVSEDLQLQDAIAAYHSAGGRDFAIQLLREFRSTLRDDELEALIDATAVPQSIKTALKQLAPTGN